MGVAMKKFRIKKIHIYLAAFGILLSGCHLQTSDSALPESTMFFTNQQFEDQLRELEKEIEILKDSFFRKEYSLEQDSVYFEKGYNTTINYDGLVLTMEEKGIGALSESAKKVINNISFYGNNNFKDYWISLFEIDSFYEKAYTSINVSSNSKTHQGKEYYNRATDTIDWDKLVNRILENSKKSITTNQRSALSIEEIKIILVQLKDFSNSIKKEYPEFDFEHLACQLSTLSLTYGPSQENGTLASTNAYNIEWFLNSEGNYPILQTSIGLNEHEFKHFLCEYCVDEKRNGNCYVVPSGISYENHGGLQFSFIEEATAEEYSALRNNTNPITYFDKIEVLNNLRFVLSMQDDYEKDGFLKYSLFRNPIALVQQFPVLEDQTYFFSNNLKMLSAYNACLMSFPADFTRRVKQISGYENFDTNLEQKKEMYSSLLNYAQTELSRLFFTNLTIMNEEKEDMTLEYNFYLMRLFEKRMSFIFDVVSFYRGVTISSANYERIHQERELIMFKYLSEKYQIDLKNLKELFKEYSLSDGVTIPSFVDKDLIGFYKNLEKQNYDVNEFQKITDNGMQYYIQYSNN